MTKTYKADLPPSHPLNKEECCDMCKYIDDYGKRERCVDCSCHQELSEKKCKNCGHGICKTGNHCHNQNCPEFYPAQKLCYDTLIQPTTDEEEAEYDKKHCPECNLDFLGVGVDSICPECSEEFENKPMIGKNNHQWKGEDVGYASLHEWIRNHKPIPVLCDNCKLEKKLDLANISQEYKRDLRDWEWLCRSCHMNKDGRIRNLSRKSKKHSLETKLKIGLKSKGNKNVLGKHWKWKSKCETKFSTPSPTVSEDWATIKQWLLDTHAEYQDRNGLDYCKNCGINHEEIVEKIDTLLKAEREKYIDALIWCSGSEDFQFEGKAREGWEKICRPLLNNNGTTYQTPPEIYNSTRNSTGFDRTKAEYQEAFKAGRQAEREKWEDREIQVMKEMEIMHDFKIKGIQEGRQAERTEILEKIEKMKSDCKQYHNEWIDTPDKIKGFNFAIECIINILKKQG